MRSTRTTGRSWSPPPHTLRHAYCDHVARHAGLQVAQQTMGHANLATTELYLSQPTLDEISHAMRHVTLGTGEHTFQGRDFEPVIQ
jgi:site-specific recombinase XerD